MCSMPNFARLVNVSINTFIMIEFTVVEVVQVFILFKTIKQLIITIIMAIFIGQFNFYILWALAIQQKLSI